MACDTCGKVGVALEPLREIYKTEIVAHICGDCEKVVNKHLEKVQAVTREIQFGLMRRFLDSLKAKLTTKDHP